MKIRRLVSGGTILVLFLVTVPVGAQNEGDMDHAALASSYQQEANEARAKAASHEQMLNRYKSMPALPKGSPTTKEAMVKHCQKLVDSYKASAAQAADLAKAHQQLAQPAK